MNFLPDYDVEYLKDKDFDFQEIIENGKNGLIIKGFSIPESKYNSNKADILIFIPKGYNDNPLDMFYVYPHLFLLPDNKPPKATQARENFHNINWQRWSRHASTPWRPGVDSIRTMIQIINNALKEARI